MAIPMVLGSSLAAGRRFLGLSQERLAAQARVHRTTVVRFEHHNAEPVSGHPLQLQAVVSVLERGGIEFLPDGSVVCRSACQGGADA